MTPMNKKVLAEVLLRPQICSRINEGMCEGRMSIEHAFGRKYEALWNCIWLCEKHAGIGRWWDKQYFDKELNKHLAYKQSVDADLRRFKSYEQMKQEKIYLQKKYENKPCNT